MAACPKCCSTALSMATSGNIHVRLATALLPASAHVFGNIASDMNAACQARFEGVDHSLPSKTSLQKSHGVSHESRTVHGPFARCSRWPLDLKSVFRCALSP